MKYLAPALVFLIGVAGVLAGGADDSPGLQLIGVVLAIGSVVRVVQIARRPKSD